MAAAPLPEKPSISRRKTAGHQGWVGRYEVLCLHSEFAVIGVQTGVPISEY